MYSTSSQTRGAASLATRFARNTRVLRSDQPLGEDQMRTAAPSIFAEGKHVSRSERYTYIPTSLHAHGVNCKHDEAVAAISS